MAKQAKEKSIMGASVVDQVTGFKGTVTAVITTLSGSIMGHVTPKVGKDGKMPDTWTIDAGRLTYLRAGPAKAIPADDTSHVRLGSTAKDTVTGVEGVLTEKAVYLNGCTQFIITAQSPKKDERTIAVDWKRLDLSQSKPAVTPPATELPVKGGPSRRVEQYG